MSAGSTRQSAARNLNTSTRENTGSKPAYGRGCARRMAASADCLAAASYGHSGIAVASMTNPPGNCCTRIGQTSSVETSAGLVHEDRIFRMIASLYACRRTMCAGTSSFGSASGTSGGEIESLVPRDLDRSFPAAIACDSSRLATIAARKVISATKRKFLTRNSPSHRTRGCRSACTRRRTSA